jgi:predicted small integral membrane protein
VSTPPDNLPPSPSTQIVGQQTGPSSVVPHTPHLETKAPTNGLAWVSLMTGILSYFGHIIPLIGGSTLALVAIVSGWIARRQIARSGEQGRDLATIGIVLGVVNLAIVVLILVAIFFLVFVLGISILGIAAHSSR